MPPAGTVYGLPQDQGSWFADEPERPGYPRPAAAYTSARLHPADYGTPAAQRPVVDFGNGTPADPAMPDLRNRIVNRLHRLNVSHAGSPGSAAAGIRSAPTCWCSATPNPLRGAAPPRPGDQLAVFLGTEILELPRLLRQMHTVIGDLINDGKDDPRVSMSNTSEPMSENARYVGLAVSSLDTPKATWAQTRRTAHSEIDIPGRCYGVLTTAPGC